MRLGNRLTTVKTMLHRLRQPSKSVEEHPIRFGEIGVGDVVNIG